jgi:hypothetical protein
VTQSPLLTEPDVEDAHPLATSQDTPSGGWTPAEGAPSFRAYLTRSWATAAAIGATIGGVFLTVVIVPYAYTDDYTLLWMSVSGEATAQFGMSIMNVNALGGRPLMGLFDEVGFGLANGIGDLRFLRLVSVLGIAALAVLVHYALVRARVASVPAALIAILMCLVPALQVYGAWATLYSQPFAALSAGVASLTIGRSLDGERRLRNDRLAGAGALLVAGLFVYQPAAMFFWVFLAIGVAGARYEPDRAVRLAKGHLGVAAVAFAVAYVFTKLIVHVVDNGSTTGERSTLTHDVAGKLRLFWHEPLYRALNLVDVTPTARQAVVVGAVAVTGIFVWLGRYSARPGVYVVIGAALLPLSYLPNLVVEDMWPPYRTQIATASLVALYLGLGVLGLWVVVTDALRPRVERRHLRTARAVALGLAFVFVGAAAVVASTNVSSLIVEPQMTELRLLKRQVNDLPPGALRVSFVLTDWYGGLTDTVIYDEFGLASSVRPWAPEPAIDLLLRESGRPEARRARPAVDIYSPGTTALPANQPIIDLQLQRYR